MILIPREFPAAQTGRAAGTTKSMGASTAATSSNKRRASSASTTSNKRRQSSGDNSLLDISMDFGGGLGDFDNLDLDFNKPLDEHEQAAAQQNNFSPF